MNRRARITIAALCGVIVLVAATGASAGGHKSAQESGQQQSEQAFLQQRLAVPYPAEALKDSLERRNLREKLMRLNKPDKIGYLYELSDTGSVVGFYTIKGKVSSTDSQMTTLNLVNCHWHFEQGCEVVQAPGDDGSYGPNEPGIFFFTTEGVMLTWNGKYQYSDAPLKLTSAPLLVLPAESKPSSTGG